MEIEKPQPLELSSYLELLIFLITQKFSLSQVDLTLKPRKIDSNYYILDVLHKGNPLQFKIKLLQILDAVKILVINSQTNAISSFYINLKAYLLPKVKNSFKLDEKRQTAHFFQRERYESFMSLVEYRILRFVQPLEKTKLNLLELPMEWITLIAQYLGKKDVLNLLMVSSKANEKLNKDMKFWWRLYHLKFRKTGFKVEMLNWKAVYLKKVRN